MSQITQQQFQKLRALGKEPLNLPAEIFFGGDERLQKSPGNHHLPQHRTTGTYNLPALKENRRRVAMDRAKRLRDMKMTEVELRKIGGITGLQNALAEHGLKLNEEQNRVISMHADMLMKEWEAKKQDRAVERAELEKQVGQPIPEIVADTARPIDTVKATQRAMAEKLSPADNLASGDENEKEKTAKAEGIPEESQQSEDMAFESI